MKIIIIIATVSVLAGTSFASTINRNPEYGHKQEIPGPPGQPALSEIKVETSAREQGLPGASPEDEEKLDEEQAKAEAERKGAFEGQAEVIKEKLDEEQAKAEAERKGAFEGQANVNQYYSGWPRGRYALPKTTSGCPYGWSNGSRYQDNEDNFNTNSESVGIESRMDVDVGSNTEIRYCVKTTTGNSFRFQWPSGTYCIARRGGSCPSGFSSGSVYWDDEDSWNANSRSGTLPDGVYGRNTKIYFCCRSDGSYLVSISLPTSTPFYLYRYGQNCQRVNGMSVVEDFIRTDDEDSGNSNFCTGAHPAGTCGRNIRINFCYYRSR